MLEIEQVQSTYRIDRSFEWNVANGPSFERRLPEIPETPLKDFFGLPVRSRFGVAASLLLNANWCGLYSRLGFDLLTYKTVRLRPRVAHPIPNWLFLDQGPTARLEDNDVAQRSVVAIPAHPDQVTAAGSIGIPSTAPEVWQPDIRRCRESLRDGQVLIVSIVATADASSTVDSFVAEFEKLAAMVRASGAQIVEANLSCPNVRQNEGEVYRDTPLVASIAAAVRRGAGNLPVLMKIGALEDPAAMAGLLGAVAGVVDGMVMINAVSRQVIDASGQPAFGAGRLRGGIMGSALHRIALDQVRQAVAIVERDKLGLKIVGVGGVSSPQRARAFIDAGACAALGASSLAWNPYLAAQIKKADPAI